MNDALTSLQAGQAFPFDAPDGYDGTTDSPLPAIDWAHFAARVILADLSGRRGVGDELEAINEDTRLELVQSLAAIIRLAPTGFTG